MDFRSSGFLPLAFFSLLLGKRVKVVKFNLLFIFLRLPDFFDLFNSLNGFFNSSSSIFLRTFFSSFLRWPVTNFASSFYSLSNLQERKGIYYVLAMSIFKVRLNARNFLATSIGPNP